VAISSATSAFFEISWINAGRAAADAPPVRSTGCLAAPGVSIPAAGAPDGVAENSPCAAGVPEDVRPALRKAPQDRRGLDETQEQDGDRAGLDVPADRSRLIVWILRAGNGLTGAPGRTIPWSAPRRCA
jgi:hypothetical protein